MFAHEALGGLRPDPRGQQIQGYGAQHPHAYLQSVETFAQVGLMLFLILMAGVWDLSSALAHRFFGGKEYHAKARAGKAQTH